MNNVNVQEMERFVSTIQEDPTQAKKDKRVTASWVFEQGRPQSRGCRFRCAWSLSPAATSAIPNTRRNSDRN
jgi:hypothetical protein